VETRQRLLVNNEGKPRHVRVGEQGRGRLQSRGEKAEGVCRAPAEGACREDACREDACREGACREGACRAEGRGRLQDACMPLRQAASPLYPTGDRPAVVKPGWKCPAQTKSEYSVQPQTRISRRERETDFDGALSHQREEERRRVTVVL
jgi:hypothetical protein